MMITLSVLKNHFGKPILYNIPLSTLFFIPLKYSREQPHFFKLLEKDGSRKIFFFFLIRLKEREMNKIKDEGSTVI